MKKIFTLLVIALIGSGSLFAQNIQFINNIADPTVGTVNIYFVWTSISGGGSGDRGVYDSIIGSTFRSASPYKPVIGEGWIYTVYMVPSGQGVTDTASGTILGTVGPINSGDYAVIASGLTAVDAGNYVANPNGLPTTFSLSTFTNARQQAVTADSLRDDLLFFNGVTDAPILTVNYINQTGTAFANLVPGMAYGFYDAGGYFGLASSNYILYLTDTAGNPVGYYWLPIDGIKDSAGVIFTSGFIDSTANGNGAAFGLYLASASGNVLPLQFIYPAAVQVIHDAPDTSIKSVEVFIATADSSIISQQPLTYGSSPATTYLPIIAETPLLIGFAPAGSTTLSSSFALFNVNALYPGSSSVFITSGVLDTASYPANPEGNSTAFSLNYHAGLITDTVPGTASLLFFQGVPDDSTLNLFETAPDSGVTLVSAIQYGYFNGYQTLDTSVASDTIAVTDSAGTSVYKTFSGDISLAAGYGVVVFAGGFVDTSFGVPFQLYGSFPNGLTIPLSLVTYTGINNVQYLDRVELYPNPATTTARLSFNLETSATVQYRLLNMLGQEMQFTDMGNLNVGVSNVDINVAGLSNGVYLLDIILNNNTHVTRTIEVTR